MILCRKCLKASTFSITTNNLCDFFPKIIYFQYTCTFIILLLSMWFLAKIVYTYFHYIACFVFISDPRPPQHYSSSTMNSWVPPIMCWWILTSLTSPFKTNWILSSPWWIVCMLNVSQFFVQIFNLFLQCSVWWSVL